MRLKLKCYLLIVTFLIGFSTSCNDELIIEPSCEPGIFSKISSLTEIVDFIPVDRTDEILDCKEHNLFRFTGACGEFSIINEPNICNPESVYIPGSIWVKEKDELEKEVLMINLQYPYVLHDSFTFGRTVGDYADQFYEIVRRDKNIIILQSHPELSIPKTKNIWQLTLITSP